MLVEAFFIKLKFRKFEMLRDVRYKDIEQVFKTPVVQQTAFWSKIKKQLGVESLALNFKVRKSLINDSGDGKGYIISDLLILLMRPDVNHYIAYVPYGPEIEPNEDAQGVFLEELSEQLRPFLPRNCIMIRYDLAWESLWANEGSYYDVSGGWMGPPEKNLQELRVNMCTAKSNLRKAGSNILPSNTIYLNLSRSKELLLQGMKPKTRYNIMLSGRKGVNVRIAGLENLGLWYELYTETAARNNFYLHSIEYFRVILTERANDTLSPAEVLLLIAEVDSIPLAAMFLVISGNRATYLYGASSSQSRNYMATYSLQWRAISIAKEKGCNQYDMFGVSPNADPSHPMYGLYRFKTGFGGKLFHSMGCWDYPLDQKKYAYYCASEMWQQGYHLG